MMTSSTSMPYQVSVAHSAKTTLHPRFGLVAPVESKEEADALATIHSRNDRPNVIYKVKGEMGMANQWEPLDDYFVVSGEDAYEADALYQFCKQFNGEDNENNFSMQTMLANFLMGSVMRTFFNMSEPVLTKNATVTRVSQLNTPL